WLTIDSDEQRFLSGWAIMAGASPSSDATCSLVRHFATRWERDPHSPDVFDYLQRHPHASLRQKADVLLIDQMHRWQRGVAIPVEEYCARCPDVAGHHRLLLELIAAELDFLTQRGRHVDLDRFFGRFPDVRESVWSLLRQQQNQPQGAGYAEM